jgi:CxxC motif-containing protein (DUF1111 family)
MLIKERSRSPQWSLRLAIGAGLALAFSLPFLWLPTPHVHAQSSLGGPLPGLSAKEQQQFTQGQQAFNALWHNPDDLTTTKKAFRLGFGPLITAKGCAICHNSPVSGGNSEIKLTFFGKVNPDGTFNDLAAEGGPLQQQSTAPLLVPPLAPAGSCNLPDEVIPADATIIQNRHVPPTFGAGLIDSIADATILANAIDQGLGIHGTVNMGVDYLGNSRVGRFGFKAQQPTLVQISAAALNHDLGVTNFVFPVEDLPQGQPIPAGCDLATNHPNDEDTLDNGPPTVFLNTYGTLFSAPPAPSAFSSSAQNGEKVFNSVGCAKCHVESLTTASSVLVPSLSRCTLAENCNFTFTSSQALANQIVNLYSDLLLHDMGPVLADGIPQGQASGSQWRTTPLWGLSHRTAYLHDGRTTSLTTAIQSHGGEATIVIQNFSGLSSSDQQDLLNFLNSL